MSGTNRLSTRDPRRLAAAAAAISVLLLGGCDTFGIGGPAPAAPVPAGRPLDVRTDDLAALVVALDLPRDVQPIENGTRAELDVATASKGSRRVGASLILADGDGIFSALPPLAAGHAYYLLGFSPKDQVALAQAQKWLAALPPAAAPVSAFTVTPALCTRAAVDPATATVTVEAVLPNGPPLTPLLGPAPLAALNGGKPLPACTGD